jgi:hypothetical protein
MGCDRPRTRVCWAEKVGILRAFQLIGRGGCLVSHIDALSYRYPSRIDNFFPFFNSKIGGYIRDMYRAASGIRTVSDTGMPANCRIRAS